MTSVEALLCEVCPLMEARMAVRSGEQLFYGESLLLAHHSNEGPSTSGRHSRHSESNRHSESHSKKGKKGHSKSQQRQDGLHNAIANAKETLRRALDDGSPAVAVPQNVMDELAALKSENAEIRKEMSELRKLFQDLQTSLKGIVAPSAAPPKAEPKATEEDDDFELFDSSDEEVDEEKERIKQERLAAYAAKKALKPAGIAKSSIILDVKPWDDETDMVEMEKFVRGIEKEGLVWGGGKLIPLAYGIKKLQIIVVIEDEKVSVDDLIEKITEDGADYVQSVDVVAFNKI